jgi:multisubunit Na+/H+ antiporter MnhB subunit
MYVGVIVLVILETVIYKSVPQTFIISGTPKLNCDSYWHTDNITNTLLYYIVMLTYAKVLVAYCISPFTYITYM